MKRLLLAGTGAVALVLAGATMDPSLAATHGSVGGGGSAHVSAGGGSAGRVGGNFSANAAPRAAVTGGNYNRGVTGRTFPGRTGRTFTGRTGFTGRTAAVGGRRGHWVWRNHRRVFVPFVVGGGPWWGYNDCVVWNGWRWVNTCVGSYAWGYGPGWGPGPLFW